MCLALAVPSYAAAGANDFYVSLLHRGIVQVEGGQYEAADKELRIAAFGLVDSIPDFETAEVYLAITGDKLKSEADSRRALQRIIVADRIERRFGSLDLPAKVRAEFDAIASKLLTSDQYAFLKASPSAQLVAPAMTPQHSSAPAPVPQPVTSNPKPPPVVVAPPKPAPKPVVSKPVPAPTHLPVPVPAPAPTFNVSAQMALADQALNRNDLGTARKIYDQVAQQPGLDHATLIHLGEQSYRARDFATAARAFSRSGFNTSDAPYRYYYAVALFETGQSAAAKRELSQALPYIEVTPDVAAYRTKIENAR
jgi:tetratricopeptide (TPR) repeat protein